MREERVASVLDEVDAAAGRGRRGCSSASAEQHREQQHLQDFAARERADELVGMMFEEEVDGGQCAATRCV